MTHVHPTFRRRHLAEGRPRDRRPRRSGRDGGGRPWKRGSLDRGVLRRERRYHRGLPPPGLPSGGAGGNMEAGSAGAPAGIVREAIKWKTKGAGAEASVPFANFRNFGSVKTAAKKFFLRRCTETREKQAGETPGSEGHFAGNQRRKTSLRPSTRGTAFQARFRWEGAFLPCHGPKTGDFLILPEKRRPGASGEKSVPSFGRGRFLGQFSVTWAGGPCPA